MCVLGTGAVSTFQKGNWPNNKQTHVLFVAAVVVDDDDDDDRFPPTVAPAGAIFSLSFQSSHQHILNIGAHVAKAH